MVDSKLLKYATDRQAELLKALESERSIRKAAKKLECSHQLVSQAVKHVRKKAALSGYSPEHDYVHELSLIHI